MYDEGEKETIKKLRQKIKTFTQKIFTPGQEGKVTLKELVDINREIGDIAKNQSDLSWLYQEPILKSFRCLLLTDDLHKNDRPAGIS
jgi:hypothetical protein